MKFSFFCVRWNKFLFAFTMKTRCSDCINVRGYSQIAHAQKNFPSSFHPEMSIETTTKGYESNISDRSLPLQDVRNLWMSPQCKESWNEMFFYQRNLKELLVSPFKFLHRIDRWRHADCKFIKMLTMQQQIYNTLVITVNTARV